MSSGTIALQLVLPAIARARKVGLDFDDLLTELEIPRRTFDDPDARLPWTAAMQLWEELARRSGSPIFGIDAAREVESMQFDLHEYLVRCSPTLGAGLRRMFRYIELLSSRGHMEVEVTDHELRIVNSPPGVLSWQGHLCAFHTLWSMVRRAVGRPVALVRVEQMVSPPEDPELLAAVFGCPIVFGAPANMLAFPRALETTRLPAHDDRLLNLIERQASTMVDALADEKASLTDRARRCLFQHVQRGELSIDQVARQLGASVRTLQRELRADKTSFRDLVDEVRRDVAISHMTHGVLPITAIALLLDFSDVSAFHRSFRRWTGQAPSVFRAAQRAR